MRRRTVKRKVMGKATAYKRLNKKIDNMSKDLEEQQEMEYNIDKAWHNNKITDLQFMKLDKKFNERY